MKRTESILQQRFDILMNVLTVHINCFFSALYVYSHKNFIYLGKIHVLMDKKIQMPDLKIDGESTCNCTPQSDSAMTTDPS